MSKYSLLVRRVYILGLLGAILLALIDVGVFFYSTNETLRSIFLATQEQTPLTWISSLSFLIIAVISWVHYYNTKLLRWKFVALAFLFFSMDDAIYLHERIGRLALDTSSWLTGFPTYVWSLIYAPILILSIGIIVWHVRRHKVAQRYALISLVLLGIAFAFDVVDGWIIKDIDMVYCLSDTCSMIVVHIMRLSEEVLEILGLGLLGYGLLQWQEKEEAILKSL